MTAHGFPFWDKETIIASVGAKRHWVQFPEDMARFPVSFCNECGSEVLLQTPDDEWMCFKCRAPQDKPERLAE